MPDFFDYDPVSGFRYETSFDEEAGTISVHSTQDVSAVLDYTKAMARDGLTDKGIKEGWWLYAKIPLVVLMKMKAEKGINAFDPRESDRVIRELNEFYPHLKTTQKHHGGRQAVIYDNGRKR